MNVRRGIAILPLLALLATPAETFGQTQKKQASKKKAPPAAKKEPAAPDFRMEAGLLTDQLKLLERFLFVYGRLSASLEAADDRVEQNRKNKQQVVANIGSFRVGIEKVAREFQMRPELSRHYVRLLSAAEGIGQAEAHATAGRFEPAGRVLVEVTHRLTDILAELQGPLK